MHQRQQATLLKSHMWTVISQKSAVSRWSQVVIVLYVNKTSSAESVDALQDVLLPVS